MSDLPADTLTTTIAANIRQTLDEELREWDPSWREDLTESIVHYLAPAVVSVLATHNEQIKADAWREGAAAGHHSPLTWFALRQCNPYRLAAVSPTPPTHKEQQS